MQQFVVPQFITVENKILGPIDTRQFVFLLVGMGLMFLEYKLLAFLQFAILGVLTMSVMGLFAFVKVNGRPFHVFLTNIVQTFSRPHLRVWDSSWQLVIKTEEKGKKERIRKKGAKRLPPKRVGPSRLSDLSLIVDTGGVYEGEK